MKHLISSKAVAVDENQQIKHTYRIEPRAVAGRLAENCKQVGIQHRVSGSCVESQGDENDRIYTELKGPYNVLEYEQWNCEVKEVHEGGLRLYAIDSKHVKNSRSFTMKRSYFESLCEEPFETMTEGVMFDWTFKRVKRENGVISKKEEISVYKRISIPKWQLQQQVAEEMKELAFLFQSL